jgi:hypothetical protein
MMGKLREAGNLAKYFNRSPAELGEDELKEYMLYLMKERRLSDGTYRFYVAALKFLYRTTLKCEWVVEKIKCPKRKKKLPVKDNIAVCRNIIGGDKPIIKKDVKQETWQEQLLRICGIDVTVCPVCQKGRRFRTALLLPHRCNSPPELRR